MVLFLAYSYSQSVESFLPLFQPRRSKPGRFHFCVFANFRNRPRASVDDCIARALSVEENFRWQGRPCQEQRSKLELPSIPQSPGAREPGLLIFHDTTLRISLMEYPDVARGEREPSVI